MCWDHLLLSTLVLHLMGSSAASTSSTVNQKIKQAMDTEAITVCGHQIPEVLNLFCRFHNEPFYDAASNNDDNNLIPDSVPTSGRVKRSGGVAHECCTQSCYIRNLLGYCKEAKNIDSMTEMEKKLAIMILNLDDPADGRAGRGDRPSATECEDGPSAEAEVTYVALADHEPLVYVRSHSSPSFAYRAYDAAHLHSSILAS